MLPRSAWHCENFRMRIITGKFKGRTLETLRDHTVRPATDRVKKTIFDVLQSRLDLRNVQVLDLFAGSGSLGFEALSRGAAQAVFVDDSKHVLDIVEANAERLGCIDHCIIVQTDALSFIKRTNDRFDLIFVDPPYSNEGAVKFPELILERGLLKTGGFIIMEHARRTVFDTKPSFRLAVQKEFGNTRVSFFTHPADSPTVEKHDQDADRLAKPAGPGEISIS